MIMDFTKECSKCHKTKLLDEFYNQKSGKYGKRADCKKCNKEENRKYHQEHKEYNKKYYEEHKDELRVKAGHLSMYENKLCSSYLGIVIAERLCRHLFKDVEVMPHGNTGFDIICNKGKKIDVKSATITFNGKYPRWQFAIRRNTITDYFILVAFDNVENLNPLYLWMIPGHILNKQSTAQIYPSTVHKWNEWERNIKDAQLCCAEMKKEK